MAGADATTIVFAGTSGAAGAVLARGAMASAPANAWAVDVSYESDLEVIINATNVRTALRFCTVWA